MTFSAALLLLAPIAVSAQAGVATDEPSARGAGSAPIASATASARILRPVSVRVRKVGDRLKIETPREAKPQTERDAAGTLWIEFS